MDHFTPFSSLAGGALIGLAAAGLLLFHGRIAGISGILGGLIRPRSGESLWRALFVAGLVAGGAMMFLIHPDGFAVGVERSLGAVAAAGFLVGLGTRLGGGCTSGHGVCGNARLSVRSMAATATFIATGAATVWAGRAFFGGVL